MRHSLVLFAIATTLLSAPPAHADWGFNDGENGVQIVSVDMGDTGKVVAACEFTTVGKPNTNFTKLVVLVQTTSTADVSHGVRCKVTNSNGGVDTAAALPQNNSVAVATAEVEYAPFTLCLSVSTYDPDTGFTRSREVCRLPPDPLSHR